MRTLLPLIFFLLVGNPALGQRLTLKGAEKQLSHMEYDGAVETAKAVLERGSNSLEELKRAYVVLGHALAVLGQSSAAKFYYTRLLVIDPAFILSKNVSPKVRAPLVEAKSDRTGLGLTAVHHPPASGHPDQPLVLRIQVVSDPLAMVQGASVRYILPGRSRPSTLGVGGEEKELVLAIPLPVLDAKAGTLSYQINLLDVHNNVIWTQGPVEVKLGGDKEPAAVTGGVDSGTGGTGGTGETGGTGGTDGIDESDGNGGVAWYKRWWVWTIAGVVVAGAATAAVVVTTRPTESDMALGWEVGP